MPTIRRAELIVVSSLALASALAAWALVSAGLVGLDARYWNNTEWSGPPAATATGAMPTASDFLQRRDAGQFRPGSAEWTGWLAVDQAGDHQFDLLADDGAQVFVGDRLVVERRVGDGSVRATGRVRLPAGPHPLRIRYFQAGDGLALGLWWTRPGGRAEPLTAGDVAPSRRAAGRRAWVPFARRLSVTLPVAWAILLLYLPVRFAGAWVWGEVRRALPGEGDRRALVLLLLLGGCLTAWRIDWGVAGDAWAPDELTPGLVRWALDARFSGGWHDKYPLMHFVVLSVPVSAFELADRLSILPVFGLEAHTAMLALMRAVSVVMGLGALIGAALCGAEMVGPRRGALGAAALLLTPLFVYYGKTANLDVPSLCFFAWAVLALLRIATRNRLRDYVMLGVAAAASVATKDQMYASVALLPLVPLVAAARDQQARAWWRRLAAGLVDARLLWGAAAAAAAFAVFHNVPFNFSGFLAHVKVLYTFPSLALVPRTAAGYVELTTRTIELFRFALGWPFFVLAAAGIASAVRRRERRWWLWLLLVPLSSHLTFTLVALYVNDRYLFGGVFVLALFAGAAASDLWDARRWRVAARAAVCLSLAWSFLYAASVNAMMTRDARAAARAWIVARSGIETVVGAVGWYVPYLAPPLRTARLESPEDVRSRRADLVVVNERFAGRLAAARPSGWQRAIAGLRDGSLGYREAFRRRSPIPRWAVLQYEAPFRSDETSDLTNLDKINPETVVYERAPQ